MNKRVDQAADRLISAFMKDELKHRCAHGCAVATIAQGYFQPDYQEETDYKHAELKEIETTFEQHSALGWGGARTQIKSERRYVTGSLAQYEIGSFEALLAVFNVIEKLNPEYFEANMSILDKAVFETVDL